MMVLIQPSGPDVTGGSGFVFNWGILLFMIQLCCSAAYLLLQKRYIFKTNPETGETEYLYPPWTMTAYAYYFGALTMSLAAIPNDILVGHTFRYFDVYTLIPLAYAVFISSVVCYGALAYANSITSSTVVSIFFPLQAVVTFILSWIFLNETPAWYEWVGAGLITIGVVLVCISKWLQEKETNKQLQELAVN